MKPRILWWDGLGGLVVGALVLIAAPWLSALYGMPLWFVVFTGIVNVAYGSYSTTLVLRKRRTAWQLRLLWRANAVWAVLCFIYIAWLIEDIRFLGVFHLVAEGLYVGALAILERKWIATLIRD